MITALDSRVGSTLDMIGTTCNQRGRLALAQGPAGWRKPPVTFGLRIRGGVDAGFLTAVLTAVAGRHTALRMTFPVAMAGQYGVAVNQADVVWRVRSVDMRDAAGSASVLRELHRTFAPEEYPLFRGFLLRYPGEDVLALAIDHVVFDGASVPVFLADFERVYRMLSSPGDRAGSDPGGSDVARFSEYERDWLAGPEAGDALAYWREVWSSGFGPFPRTDLPAPVRRDGPSTGAVWRRVLDRERVGREQSRHAGHLSLPALAAGAVVTALRDLTGSPECGLLYPSSRRVFAGAADMVGYLNNRVLLRVDTPRDATADEILRGTRSALLDSLEYHMMPFEVLLDRLAPDLLTRPPDRPYVHLNVQRRPSAPALPGLEVSFSWLDEQSGQHDLPWISVDLDEGPELVLAAGYSRAHVDGDLVAGLMSRVARQLTGSTDDDW
jgi:hypothetical protein